MSGMGLKGLVLLFDEAEAVEQYYYQYQLNKSYNFLRALIRTANNEAELRSAPKQVDLDLESCRMGDGPRIPFLFNEVSGLKLVFAFTSLDWNRADYDWYEGVTRLRIPELENAPQVSLQHLSDEALREVLEHICLLYADAYDYLEDGSIDPAFHLLEARDGRTRMFVKGAVEALDLARFYGWESLSEVSRR